MKFSSTVPATNINYWQPNSAFDWNLLMHAMKVKCPVLVHLPAQLLWKGWGKILHKTSMHVHCMDEMIKVPIDHIKVINLEAYSSMTQRSQSNSGQQKLALFHTECLMHAFNEPVFSTAYTQGKTAQKIYWYS